MFLNLRKSRKKNLILSKADGGLALALLSVMLLEGCSTIYSPSAGVRASADAVGADNPSADTLTPAINGRAINGYLVNALVFQDANKDGMLSLNENIALTDASGNFSLPGSSHGDLIVKPINLLSDAEKADGQSQLRAIGLINPDFLSTYYESSSGVRKDFKGQLEISGSMLSAEVNITPLTTLVNGLVSSGQFDLSSANEKVTSLFGMASTTDYVALSAASSAQQARQGEALQNKAVALSNLLTSTFSFFDDSLSNQALLQMLALKVTKRLEDFTSSPMGQVDISSYLASSADIKSILLEIGKESDLEINLALLASVIDNLVSTNSSFIDDELIRLTEDTGVSGIDHITSNWQLTLPTLEASKTYEFGIEHRLVGQDEAWLPTSWFGAMDALDITQGVNTIFIKPQGASDDEIVRVAFQFDNLNPLLSTVAGAVPIETWISTYFLPDDNTYTAQVKLVDEFFLADAEEDDQVLPQYQLVRADGAGKMPSVNAEAWLDFANISSRTSANGVDMRLYYRQMDLAGNFSESSHFDFIYDNVKPQTLLSEDVSLQIDSGIYDYDRYTSNLNLEALESRYATLFDESTVMTLGQWNQSGQSVNQASFDEQPDAPTLDGRYTFVTLQVDRAGNFSELLQLDYELDTQAPEWVIGSGLMLDNGHSLPLLNYDRSQESLNEWVQYRMVDMTLPAAQQNLSPWLNINTVSKPGSYDLYYRVIDRAGNSTSSQYAGVVNIDNTAPVVTVQDGDRLSSLALPEVVGWLKNHTLVQSETSVDSKIAFQINSANPYVSLTHFYVTAVDPYRNVTSPWSVAVLTDDVLRREFSVTDSSSFLVQAEDHQATDFLLNAATESLIAIGSDMSDKVNALDVGDIFIGLGGGDLSVIDTSLDVTGLAFLNESETQFFIDSFGDNLTVEQLQRLVSTPILKAYLEDSNDPDAGGIAIFQSQFAQYTSGLYSEYLMTQWNPYLEKWFINLGANDDNMYFGGDAMNVIGGAGSDLLQGGVGNDYLVGGPGSANGADILRGFAGNDTLVSGDYLFYSHGNAVLEGGSGDDTLIAGNGSSQLRGDVGADLFVIAPIKGSAAPIDVEILDFSPGADFLHFVGLQKDDAMRGIFVDHANGNIEIDLVSLLGPDSAPYGSVLTLSGLGTDGLLPETIAESWFSYSNSETFNWSDLSIDTITWI